MSTLVVAYDAHSVPNDSVILVRNKNVLGAFFLSNQTNTPNEEAQYSWALYENDDDAYRWVKKEEGSGRTGDVPKKFLFLKYVKLDPIRFGPFKLYWSSHRLGRGWVYFDYYRSHMPNEYCIWGKSSIDIAVKNVSACFEQELKN